jgi:hypothetical protein
LRALGELLGDLLGDLLRALGDFLGDLLRGLPTLRLETLRLLFLGAFLEELLARRFRTRLGFLEGFLERLLDMFFTLGFLMRRLDFGIFFKLFLDIYYMYI